MLVIAPSMVVPEMVCPTHTLPPPRVLRWVVSQVCADRPTFAAAPARGLGPCKHGRMDAVPPVLLFQELLSSLSLKNGHVHVALHRRQLRSARPTTIKLCGRCFLVPELQMLLAPLGRKLVASCQPAPGGSLESSQTKNRQQSPCLGEQPPSVSRLVSSTLPCTGPKPQ